MKLNLKSLFFDSWQVTLMISLFTISIYSATTQKSNFDYHSQIKHINHHKNEELQVFKNQHDTRLRNIAEGTKNELAALNRKTKLLIDDARLIKDTRKRNATIKQINRNASQAYRDIKAQRKIKIDNAVKLRNQQLNGSAKRHNDQLINLKKAHAQVTPAKHAATNTSKNKPKKQSITSKSNAPKVIPVTPKPTVANSKSSSQTRQRAFSNFTTIKTN